MKKLLVIVLIETLILLSFSKLNYPFLNNNDDSDLNCDGYDINCYFSYSYSNSKESDKENKYFSRLEYIFENFDDTLDFDINHFTGDYTKNLREIIKETYDFYVQASMPFNFSMGKMESNIQKLIECAINCVKNTSSDNHFDDLFFDRCNNDLINLYQFMVSNTTIIRKEFDIEYNFGESYLEIINEVIELGKINDKIIKYRNVLLYVLNNINVTLGCMVKSYPNINCNNELDKMINILRILSFNNSFNLS